MLRCVRCFEGGEGASEGRGGERAGVTLDVMHVSMCRLQPAQGFDMYGPPAVNNMLDQIQKKEDKDKK